MREEWLHQLRGITSGICKERVETKALVSPLSEEEQTRFQNADRADGIGPWVLPLIEVYTQARVYICLFVHSCGVRSCVFVYFCIHFFGNCSCRHLCYLTVICPKPRFVMNNRMKADLDTISFELLYALIIKLMVYSVIILITASFFIL